jgi:hypothetical protein
MPTNARGPLKIMNVNNTHLITTGARFPTFLSYMFYLLCHHSINPVRLNLVLAA